MAALYTAQKLISGAEHFLEGKLGGLVSDPSVSIRNIVSPPLSGFGKEISLNKIFERSIVSALNSNMKSGVIGKSIGEIERVGLV